MESVKDLGRGVAKPLPSCRYGSECAAMRWKRHLLFQLCSVFGLLLRLSTTARADESIIKNPGDHPDYRFEAEPHGLVGFGGPFKGGSGELGLGFRGTVIIVDNGFVKSINNSV